MRITRTRSEAARACKGGHVKVNGRAARPATSVKIGDRVEAYVHDRDRILIVRELLSKRTGAGIAKAAYVDRSPAPPRREDTPIAVRDPGSGRPTKRDRRQIDRLRGRG